MRPRTRSRHNHLADSAATRMSGDSVTSRDTRESLVMPHAAVTNVEPATTIWGPTPRARHH